MGGSVVARSEGGVYSPPSMLPSRCLGGVAPGYLRASSGGGSQEMSNSTARHGVCLAAAVRCRPLMAASRCASWLPLGAASPQP